MDEKIAQALLQSLLARLDADARRDIPQFEGVISSLERHALRTLLGSPNTEAEPVETPPVCPPPAPEDLAEKIEEPLENPGTVEEQTGQQEMIEDVVPAVAEENPPAPERAQFEPEVLIPGPVATEFKLDETALSMTQPEIEEVMLCLDFGTAKSKAFAASAPDGTSEQFLRDLGLGRRDNDIDNSAYTVASSVWISDEGLMFVGSEALRRSGSLYYGASYRRRLDSLKQQLNLAGSQQDLGTRRLEPEVNPTSVDLTYEDAITFYLGYLTDLAVTELTSKPTRNFRRRFTIPAWQPGQRAWAASALARYVARAQMLADTFRGHWKNGVPADQVKAIVRAAACHDKELRYLLDGSEAGGSFSLGLLEPLAAGSGRVWADKNARNLVLVIDVGAGTTDFSLFWAVQDTVKDARRAFPICPGGDAIRMAGDIIDDILLSDLLGRVHGGETSSMRSLIASDVRRRGLRRLKEQMFINGKLEVTLQNDQTVAIELEEFLSTDRVKTVGLEIEKAVSRFLGSVDRTWRGATDNALIVLSGGGARLPMIKALQERPWEIAGRRLVFKPTPEVPEFIANTFDTDFQREYPQLAVAIGGALPTIDEKDMLVEWQGGASRSGPLERFPGTGL